MPPYRALVTRSGEDRGKPNFLKNASRLQPGTGKGPQRHCQPKQLRNNPRGCFNAPHAQPSSPTNTPSPHHRRAGAGRYPGDGRGYHHNRHPLPTPPLPTTVVPAQAGTQETGAATTSTVIWPSITGLRYPGCGKTVILWPGRSVMWTRSPSLNGSAERLRTRTVAPEGSLIPYSVNSPRNSR